MEKTQRFIYPVNLLHKTMGQQEVYNFLKDNKGRWFTSKEISGSISVSIGSVTMSLKKLRKSQMVKYKNTGKRNEFKYMFKHG
jgi:Mn-dependent DtxR family transcriptional regulator